MSETVLDPQAIENLRSVSPDDGGEFFRELVDIFLSDTPLRIAEVESSFAAGQDNALVRAAHSIKGSAGNFGATHLAQLAREIETTGKTGDRTKLQTEIPKLHTEFARVKEALEKLR